MRKSTRKTSRLDSLNIVPSCKVTQTQIDYNTDRAKLVTIAECVYTPRAIAHILKEHNLLDATWIVGPTGKELWKLDGQLARQL